MTRPAAYGCSPRSAFRHDLLLVAADLQERRLLYAELLEAGYTVLPLPGVAQAERLLRSTTTRPPLILVNVSGDDDACPASVESLLSLCSGAAVVLIVSAIQRERWESLRTETTVLLCRPVSIGEVVEVVRKTLPRPTTPAR